MGASDVIVPVTFYEVRCDEPGCSRRTVDLASEYASWSDPEAARDNWTDFDGIVLDDGRAFCEKHARGKTCDSCEESGPTIVNHDGDYLCVECAEEETTESTSTH